MDTCLCFGGGSCSRQQANDGGAASESVYRLNGLSHLCGQPGAVILFYHPPGTLSLMKELGESLC